MLTPRAQVHEQQAYDAVYTKDGWVGAVHSKLCTSNLVSKPLWLTEVQVRNFDPTHPPVRGFPKRVVWGCKRNQYAMTYFHCFCWVRVSCHSMCEYRRCGPHS